MSRKSDNFHKALEAAGRKLILDEEGNIDIFVVDADYHNGPGCSICDRSWCQHCDREIKPCPGPKKIIEEDYSV